MDLFYLDTADTAYTADTADNIDSEEDFCAICQQTIEESKHTLDCKHTFCSGCIVRHFRGSSDCRCPVCRDTGGIEYKENNYFEDIPIFTMDMDRIQYLQKEVKKFFKNDKKLDKKRKKLIEKRKNIMGIRKNVSELYKNVRKTDEWKEYMKEKTKYRSRLLYTRKSMAKIRTECIEKINDGHDLSDTEYNCIYSHITYSMGLYI